MKQLTTEITYLLNRLLFGVLCVPGILWAINTLLAGRYSQQLAAQPAEFYMQFYQHLDSPVNMVWVASPYLVFLLIRPRAHKSAAKAQATLRIAASKGREDKVRELLDEGTSLHAANDTGHTPLHLAALTDNVEVMRILVQKDADVDIADTVTGFSPLHACASKGYINACEFLLRHGANMDAQTHNGETALHLATRHKHIDTVALLLDFHANHCLKNKDGLTSEQLAIAKHDSQIAHLIQQHAGSEWLYPRMLKNR